ncbi:hypothetical protein [Brevibacillus sp. HB2.2]|uniref:hypothetical protein n=1 Tax=Brevibacillus sp. HB2.2 TaxID=2738846 RepID=UPI00156BCFE0|nr:hypothetical protein [Brevibacillus sp. HB2.2]NRS50458.1 hypothetical protein [Brevibacillus sp. HB2.2]
MLSRTYEEQHIEQVITEIKAHFHDYFDRFMESGAGTSLSADQIQKLAEKFGSDGAVKTQKKNIGAVLKQTILEGINEFEKDRQSYVFNDVKHEALKELIGLTKTKNMITTMKKSGKSVQEISTIVFEAIVTEQVKLAKSLGKCLIIYSHAEELDDQALQQLEQYSAEKRSYKHALLDYFVHLIENCENSRQIHQEIGRHLGVPKFLLDRIYKTTKGDLVRSKSEVIIANLLHQYGVSYEYEKELGYGSGSRLSPDFTITINGEEFYWEHLGLIGNMEYDSHWVKKQTVYEEYFPGQLVVSYENPYLTTSAESIIQKFLSPEEF